MSVTRPTDLFYGHLGEAIYDVDSHQWHFNRIPHISRKIGPLGAPLTVLQPSLEQGSLKTPQRAVERTQEIKKLGQSFSELVPGISCISKLAQESETICKNVTRHDPATSNLFAFGKASDHSLGCWKSRTKANKVPIIAVAGGSAGNAVRLIRLQKEQIGWQNNSTVRLTNFLLQDKEQGCWFTNGTPIQQLCFAEIGGKAKARLAVRYHGGITILEPLLQPYAVPTRSFYDPDLRRARHFEARLDANPVLTLTTGRTGGSPHADVSFNPWRTAQFAIIDQKGHWTIWELNPNIKLPHGKAVDAGPSGFVSDEQTDGELNIVNKSGDGWGAIIWAGDKSTVVVADRKILSAFSIKNDIKRLFVPKLLGPKSADWILDMKRSPLDPSQVLLLTSTRIFWLQIILGDDDSQNEGTLEPGLTILLSWVHFRDQHDVSLRLDVLDDEDTTMVVLYSRLTNLTSIFTFRMPQSSPKIPLSISDPYLLTLAGTESNSKSHNYQQWSGENPSVSSLELRVAMYEFRRGSTPSGLGAVYRENSTRFYHLSILYSDLSLQKCIYVGQAVTDSSHVLLPVVQYRQKIHKAPLFVSEDAFIVPNRVSAKDWEDHDLKSEPRVGLRKDDGGYESTIDDDSRTLNFEWLAQGIQNLLARSSTSNANASSRENLDECLHVIQAATENKLKTSTPQLELLLEMLKTTVAVEDIDVASGILDDFLTSLRNMRVNTEEDNKNTCNFPHISQILNSQISTLVLPPSATGKNQSLSHIYDSLLSSWISSLPETVPSRVRIVAEKNLRAIALQLYLAGLGVHVSSREDGNEVLTQESSPSIDGPFNLPLRRKSSFQKLSANRWEKNPERSSSPLVSSQISEDTGFMLPAFSGALPTPETTPSLRSKSPSILGTEDPASRRLRALASLAPQPLLPTSASNILRHWSEGKDPATYDFEATERILLAELEPEEPVDEATAKKRQRKENRLKRQRERSIASSSQQPEPTRLKESQPLSLSRSLSLSGVSMGTGMGMGEDRPPLSSQTTERLLSVPSQAAGKSAVGGGSWEGGSRPGTGTAEKGRGKRKEKEKGKFGKKRAPGF